tara:strand:- start:20696 stop:21859 length:1164 start_codon:yes stop_codon:yes gene_type:complete
MKFAYTLLVLVSVLGLTQCKNASQAQGGFSKPAAFGKKAKKQKHIVDLGTSYSAKNYDHINDTARFLAGMPGGINSPLADQRRTSAWQQHHASMDKMFDYFARSRQSSIMSWQGSELGDVSNRNVFYPFGGPDYLYAHTFFPRASRYVLVGLEPVGSVPDIATLSGGDLTPSLNNLKASMSSATNFSYFITKDMRADLSRTSINGTLPIVMTFMARTGHRIQSVNKLSSPAPGFHILATGPSGGTKSVYYFQKDLSNSGISANSNFLSFVTSVGAPTTFLKSASYLMHRNSFSNIRNAILSRSYAVVQDPSGIPFNAIAQSGYNVRLYGQYSGTLDIFREHYQPELASGYSSGQFRVKPLPFGVGYKQTSLIVAKRGVSLDPILAQY